MQGRRKGSSVIVTTTSLPGSKRFFFNPYHDSANHKKSICDPLLVCDCREMAEMRPLYCLKFILLFILLSILCPHILFANNFEMFFQQVTV